jgi:hypothetical protein
MNKIMLSFTKFLTKKATSNTFNLIEMETYRTFASKKLGYDIRDVPFPNNPESNRFALDTVELALRQRFDRFLRARADLRKTSHKLIDTDNPRLVDLGWQRLDTTGERFGKRAEAINRTLDRIVARKRKIS